MLSPILLTILACQLRDIHKHEVVPNHVVEERNFYIGIQMVTIPRTGYKCLEEGEKNVPKSIPLLKQIFWIEQPGSFFVALCILADVCRGGATT